MRRPELELLARAPLPGLAKTRLAPGLPPASVARIAAVLIARTVELAARAWPGDIVLWCTPSMAHPLFRRLAAQYPVALRQQPPGDLGPRMLSALERGITVAGAAAVMGCDVPHCPPPVLAAAGEHLACGRNVIGPATDGGFWLLGTNAIHPRLFDDVQWSVPQTAAQMRQQAARCGIRFDIILQPLRDIDTWDDLVAAASVLAPLRSMVRRHGGRTGTGHAANR